MSYYYSYYLGIKKQDGKIYPLGPYDCDGKLHHVLYDSRNFASDLHEEFDRIPDEMISDELRKEFEYKNWNDEIVMDEVKYLPLKDLPTGDYIKTGYYLIEDIKKYEETHDDWDLFYERLSPVTYVGMLLAEKSGAAIPKQKYDEEGDPIDTYSAADYMYYAHPDYHCREYDAHLLRCAAESYEYSKVTRDAEIVVLETEG